MTWDAACLEEVCGSCAMNINGRVRMACSALVDKLEWPITLEPMRKFPMVRDLAVDRTRMFESLKRVKAWIELDGTHNLGPGPRQSQSEQVQRYVLSTCITCGSCLEACPQITQDNDFMGAAPISQVRLFNLHPTGAMHADDRLHGLMGPGRHPGLREGPELRAGLPEGDSPHHVHRGDEPRRDQARGEGPVLQGQGDRDRHQRAGIAARATRRNATGGARGRNRARAAGGRPPRCVSLLPRLGFCVRHARPPGANIP